MRNPPAPARTHSHPPTPRRAETIGRLPDLPGQIATGQIEQAMAAKAVDGSFLKIIRRADDPERGKTAPKGAARITKAFRAKQADIAAAKKKR